MWNGKYLSFPVIPFIISKLLFCLPWFLVSECACTEEALEDPVEGDGSVAVVPDVLVLHEALHLVVRRYSPVGSRELVTEIIILYKVTFH